MLLVVAIEGVSNFDAYFHHKTPLNAIMMFKSIKIKKRSYVPFFCVSSGCKSLNSSAYQARFSVAETPSPPIPIMPNDLVVKKQVFEYLTSANVVYNEVAAAEEIAFR